VSCDVSAGEVEDVVGNVGGFCRRRKVGRVHKNQDVQFSGMGHSTHPHHGFGCRVAEGLGGREMVVEKEGLNENCQVKVT
jgi:hypothetical protein